MKRARKRLEVVTQDTGMFVIRTMNGPEILIKTVEKFPCLWDVKDDNHFIKEEREAAWNKVCEELFQDWHLRDDIEKFNKCADIKKRWTHIRDYYRKDLMRMKKLSPGKDIKNQKRYIFHDMLHFLAPLYGIKANEKADISESDSTTQEPNFSENDDDDDNDDKFSFSEPPAEVLPTQTKTNNLSINSRSTGKRKAEVFEEYVNIPEQDRFQPNESETANDDTKFLLSLCGDLKQLNHSQKLEFKIGVFQLLQKIMYSNTTKNNRSSIAEMRNETEYVVPSALKMSPVFINENSENSFDGSQLFKVNGKKHR